MLFKTRFRIDVRTENEVMAIDRDQCEIVVKRLATGEVYREKYDALVLSPGAAPIRPALPGIDLPGIFVLRTIPDSRRIRSWIEGRKIESAVVVGGGLVGLEMSENLASRGIKVTVIEMLDQVLPPLDPEMAEPVQEHLRQNGVSLHLPGRGRRVCPDFQWRLRSADALGRDIPGGFGNPLHRSTAGNQAGKRGRSCDWGPRRHSRG